MTYINLHLTSFISVSYSAYFYKSYTCRIAHKILDVHLYTKCPLNMNTIFQTKISSTIALVNPLSRALITFMGSSIAQRYFLKEN